MAARQRMGANTASKREARLCRYGKVLASICEMHVKGSLCAVNFSAGDRINIPPGFEQVARLDLCLRYSSLTWVWRLRTWIHMPKCMHLCLLLVGRELSC
jgi:hypothetical protein